MEKPNGAMQPQSQSIQIAIIWTPSTGQIQLAWPAVDDVIKLGMLEMAKMALMEARHQGEPKRIMPVGAIPNLH